jgi:hypothetical protein
VPARPAYFHRLAEALDVFSRLETEWIDRKTLQETLGVSKTVAWRVLRRCGATDGPGNTLLCRRAFLLQRLRSLQTTGAYEQEIRRRDRLEQNLTSLLEAARARQIPVAPATRSLELLSSRFGNLPAAGIELTPARLTIDFQGAEDFLAKIGALIFALKNDYERVKGFIENPKSEG